MGIGGFLGDIGNGVKHGLDKTVEGLNVVDRYINPFHEEQTITPGGQQAATESGTQPRGPLAPGLEDTMAGVRWVYSNAISQPIATAALMAHQSRSDSNDFFGDWSKFGDSKLWSQSWHAANHISLGQALVLDPEESRQAVESPLLYYKPPEAYLPPGFSQLPHEQQQQFLKDAGMPAVGNAFIEKMRGNSSWYRYGTGAIDFSANLFMDPTVIGGGWASQAIKGVDVIRPLSKRTGFTPAEVDHVMSSQRMTALQGALWKNRNNPQLIRNTAFADRSGMGPDRFANILTKLDSEDELNLFIRSGMGDARALEQLTNTNLQVKARLTSNWARFDNLGLMRASYASHPNIVAMVDQQMKTLGAQLESDTAMMNRYSEILDNEGLLDQLHVSRWTMDRAQARTDAQNAYRAGPARGAVSGLVRGTSRAASIQVGIPGSAGERTINSGVIHSRLWGASDFFQSPLTLIRSVKNMHPNGYMRIDTLDKDSINELRGHIARIPGTSPQQRADMLNRYLKTTTEHERKDFLENLGRYGAAKVAQRYGISPDIGVELWKKHVMLQQGEIANMRNRFTGAVDPERMRESGQPFYLDELPSTGGKIAITPFTASRLMNGHTFQDIDELAKVMARHGNRLETLRHGLGSARDAVETAADYTSYLWKFTTLFRLGYIPRVLGDDLGSQWASVGTAVMALRTARGVKNAFENGARWVAKPAVEARIANASNGIEYAQSENALLRPQIMKLKGHLAADTAQRARDVAVATRQHQAAQTKLGTLSPTDLSPRANAIRQFANQKKAALDAAQTRQAAGPSPGKTAALVRMTGRHDFNQRYSDLLKRQVGDLEDSIRKIVQGSESVKVDGVDFPAAFAGRNGEYAHDQISADTSVGNIFATNKQLVRGNLERSFDHGGQVFSATQDAEGHLKAWTHAINNVLMQDKLSRLAVKGWSIEEMTKWLERDPAGVAYRARLPKHTPTEEFARSAKYEVDQYLHTPEIRQKALQDPNGVSPGFLKKAVPDVPDRPDVHTGQIGLSQLAHTRALDRVIDRFYRYAATLPANRLSRHPLFNSFYEGHMKRMVAQHVKQTGQTAQHLKLNVEHTERLAKNARQLAARDMRGLVFDIAHRSDAAAATRFLSPFFSATAEAFQRWGRVIADKPQTVGYAANWFNAPAYLGAVQDSNGNKVDQYGYTYVPQWQLKADGSPDYSKKPKIIKRMTPKSERYIITRMPKWVVDSPLGYAMNLRESEGRLLLSQNSVNMVTQGDPWFNPGVGPIVQIPVNEFVKDKPKDAELARQLGILPFGVQNGTLLGENPMGRALSIATPAVIKNFVTAWDTSDNRYQAIKMQIMNRTIYEWEQKNGRMPNQAEINEMQKGIADRTRDYWLFSASASFIQPFATQRKDPYQFYYDQYRALRNQNPLTADDEFLKRYDQSRFIFASEISKSQGVPPTMAATEAIKKYGKYVTRHPELAALVIGPEGRGPFSPEAYNYELNNPLIPGSTEMMRSKISADEALKENQRRLGWAKYTSRMNDLNARLRKAGFESFDDEGAEDFKTEKQAWVQVYSNPLRPDGTENPYFNRAWADDYNTYNPKKYEELIPSLTDIAASPLANEPGRSDLRMLKQYLGGRMQLARVLTQMKQNGEPHTLTAHANADLRYQWVHFVDSLIEKSTTFGDLYHRYLSRDMGVDAIAEEEDQ